MLEKVVILTGKSYQITTVEIGKKGV